MGGWHIAQMNVATAFYPLDDPRISEFMGLLDEVNALAEQSPGFVWRLKSDQGNATDIKASDDPKFIVNMSLWQSPEALFDFVYRSSHRLVMAKRRQWFAPPAYGGARPGALASPRPARFDPLCLQLQAQISAAGRCR